MGISCELMNRMSGPCSLNVGAWHPVFVFSAWQPSTNELPQADAPNVHL
ncbi:hypothetical protein [Halobacillus trueperi]